MVDWVEGLGIDPGSIDLPEDDEDGSAVGCVVGGGGCKPGCGGPSRGGGMPGGGAPTEAGGLNCGIGGIAGTPLLWPF